VSDLFHQDHATVREWTDVLARVRFGTVKVAGRNITGGRIKAVAGRLADYADSDGSRVRPGIARIAVDIETDYATVKRAVQHLTRIGLLKRVRAGSRAGYADEYQLAIPVDLLDRGDLEVWSPSRHALEVKRLSDANRGRYQRREPTPDPDSVQVPDAPADTSEDADLRVPDAPAQEAVDAKPAGASRTDDPGPAGASRTDLRVPHAPATDHRPSHNYDRPPDEQLGTAVTGPRAHEADTKPDLPVLPDRCDHRLPSRRRPDGLPSCALCRRAVAADSRLAPVIPMPVRSAS
jgi:hypothetical protein